MDTRIKILTLAAARALEPRRPLAVVTGYFDILRAEHCRELAEIRQRTGAAALLVVVLPLAQEMLPQRARAELVAALRMVDYVLIADHRDLDKLSGSLQPSELVHLEEADARRTRQLIDHVHRKPTC